MADKLMVIDGNSLANRAFYAIPMLSNSQGFITNAIYGFYNMLVKVLEEEKPAYLVVTFDKGKEVFRHEVYADYKATRKETPEELRLQFPVLKDLLRTMNIAIVEREGFEADDLIGTIVKEGEKAGLENLIVTGDRDAFQLISPQTKVILTRKGISETEVLDVKEVEARYGLRPCQMIDVKGLMGDASDNIPGIPGVGEKTAVKLIKQYGDLEQVLAHWEDFKGKKLGELLRNYADQALLSKNLATIMLDVPLEIDWEQFRKQEPDYARLVELLKELEFRNILQNVQKQWEKSQQGETTEGGGKEEAKLTEYVLLANQGAVKKYLREAKNAPVVLYLETERKSPRHWAITAGGLKVAGQLPSLLSWQDEAELQGYVELIRGFLEKKAQQIIVHDWKATLLALYAETESEAVTATEEATETATEATTGTQLALAFDLLAATQNPENSRSLKPPKEELRFARQLQKKEIKDTLLMAYLLNSSRATQDLGTLLQEKLNGSILPSGEVRIPYLLEEMAKLAKLLDEELAQQEMSRLYQEVELPLTFVLAQMERTGISLDEAILAEMGHEFDSWINQLTGEIYRLAGEEINLNSPKQLGVLLFDKLGLAKGKKTKTGYSTSAEVLEALAPEHEIVAKILDYRQLVKLKSTYIDGLRALREPRMGRVYTTFNQAITATGRLSSTEPNLQNIPIRMEEGRRIRRAFLPSDGKMLLSADYSQIELRVLAHLAGDAGLIEAFRANQDIHTRTAAEVFGVSMESVTPQMRRAAKAVNFGIIYGISDFGLSRDIGISRAEAKEYIANYFARYPQVKAYLDRTVEQARAKGYVTTILNRRRYLPDIHSRNYHLRSFAERAAMNSPIQGSAADIMKLAMLKVENALQEQAFDAFLLLQVHDELILEVAQKQVKEVGRLVKKMMCEAYALQVPLKVDLQMGANWYDLQPLDL
ncbi:MAG TPA: DNA polymerase I [Peptococcaceae bacterium]|nr:DNA polymerase I [Peptococcaceae bacterium]HPZ70894.1 DNA polymerase I [Peptococcaceae bacterium]HQD54510.1 DNA polymerase I [Peptococcaceae bacterium]